MKKNKRGIHRTPQHACHRASTILSQIQGTHFDAEHPERDWYIAVPFFALYLAAFAWVVVAW